MAQETNTPKNRAPKYMKQQLTELKGEIVLIDGYSIILLLIIDGKKQIQ